MGGFQKVGVPIWGILYPGPYSIRGYIRRSLLLNLPRSQTFAQWLQHQATAASDLDSRLFVVCSTSIVRGPKELIDKKVLESMVSSISLLLFLGLEPERRLLAFMWFHFVSSPNPHVDFLLPKIDPQRSLSGFKRRPRVPLRGRDPTSLGSR